MSKFVSEGPCEAPEMPKNAVGLPGRRREIPEALEAQDNAIARLDSRLADLRDKIRGLGEKLEPVIQPMPGNSGMVKEDGPVPDWSAPLAAEIQDRASQVDSLADVAAFLASQVEMLTDRVEL